MATLKERRKILVVEPGLQFRYLILPLVVAVTTSICLLILFVVQVDTQLRPLPGADRELLSEISSLKWLTAIVVAVILLLHVALIVWLGLTASHRVAGPLYHLKKIMREVTDGNLRARVHLRTHDQLGDVATAFNQMMDAVQESQKKEKDAREAGAKPAGG